jgi:hypothetical protein
MMVSNHLATTAAATIVIDVPVLRTRLTIKDQQHGKLLTLTPQRHQQPHQQHHRTLMSFKDRHHLCHRLRGSMSQDYVQET